ncbi:ATP-binding cassette domain-containing protein [Gemmatimonas aurantiaca]|nr:ATP-binding cassette domain-containing protein [Gemmatimonas aurantiaca]
MDELTDLPELTTLIEPALDMNIELYFDDTQSGARGEQGSGSADNPETIVVKPGELLVVNSLSPRKVTEVLRAILGIRKAPVGSIALLGEDLGSIGRIRAQKLRRRLGISCGPVELVSELTVRENLALPCILKKYSKKQIRLRVERIADAFCFDELMDLSVGRLGFAERRMVMLGRALSHDPELAILETPLVGLDEFNRNLAAQEIQRLPISGAAALVFNDTSVELETSDSAD